MPTAQQAWMTWWDRYPGWVVGTAFILVYPPIYFLFQQLAYSHWLINSGIYFALIWFAPRRIWPWLIVGYALARGSNGMFSHLIFPERFPIDYGFLTWRWWLENPVLYPLGAFGDSVLLLTGVLYLRRIDVRPGDIGTPFGMGQLHIAALISALVAASKDILYVVIANDPLFPHSLRVVLGHFIGIMQVAPIAALLFVPAFRRGMSTMWRDACLVLFPSYVIILAVVQAAPDQETAEILRRTLLIGVIAMAVRHGWRGAAVALTLVSVGLQVEAKVFEDVSATGVVQAFVAVAGVMGMMFGVTRDSVLASNRDLRSSLESNLQLNYALTSAATSAQKIEAQERQQLAMELHDEFGQNLTALQIYLHALPIGTANADRMLQISGAMRSQIQHVLETLRPAALDELGLFAAVDRGSIRRVAESAGLKMDTEIRGDAQLLPLLGDFQRLAAYRILQEAVTNIVRHANATVIRIRIGVHQRDCQLYLFLEVLDNGVGRVEHLKVGNALTNLRQRVSSAGGEWHWHNRSPAGLRMHVLLRQDLRD